MMIESIERTIDQLAEKVRNSLGLRGEQLIYRQLSFNEKAANISSVLVARSDGRDKGYVWMEILPDGICCHSNALTTGPMSSMSRKPFSYDDPSLETQLRSAVMSIVSR